MLGEYGEDGDKDMSDCGQALSLFDREWALCL